MRHCRLLFLAACAAALLAACAAPQIKLKQDFAEPLAEFILSGEGKDKILYLPMRGIISNQPSEGFLSTRPGLVQETVSHLRKAYQDPDVKAVILAVDSPGGGVVDSEILYSELAGFRERSGKKLVALMFGVAASGGYYASVAADRIVAHPSTVTGSVGAVFLQPKVHELLDKIGVGTEVAVSGRNKDMGSPFRQSTPEEREMMRQMIAGMGGRFLELVAQRRRLAPEARELVATARIFTAEEARKMGLVDRVGFLADALEEARALAGLAEDARLVVYRRSAFAEDNAYNLATGEWAGSRPLAELPLARVLDGPRTGFYYLWAPELGAR
ncbi:MAG: signal peptide peptidase SppA [Thermodesulfobacteriota bacterium]